MSLPPQSDDGDDPLDYKPGGNSNSSVLDDSHYSHTRRLRAIHNAHDRVINVRNAVEDRLITGEIGEYRARRYYRGAVEALIMQVMPVLESDQITFNTDYKNEVELGTVTISPPQALVQYARQNIDRLAPGSGTPTATTHTVEGLQSVLDLPSPLTEQFSVRVEHGETIDGHTKTVQAELPRDLLDTAVHQVSVALEDADMGLNIGEKRPNNSLGQDGQWPWESGGLLPHEITDALQNGDITQDDLEQLAAGDSE